MTKIKMFVNILGIVGIFTLVLFNITAQAEEPIDCTVCTDMTITTILKTKNLIIMGYESKGIVRDNTASKFWDSDTVHGVGIIKIENGKLTGSYFDKHVAPNGDFYALEGSFAGRESHFKFIYGTGKFAGLTGSGKTIRITNGKPISPGTSQGCVKVTGTYELKK